MTELILQQLTNRPEKCLLLAVFAQSLTDSAGAAAGRVLHEDVPGFLLHGVVHGEGKVDAVLFYDKINSFQQEKPRPVPSRGSVPRIIDFSIELLHP